MLLSLLIVFPILICSANVQAQDNPVAIKSATEDSEFYTSAGQNWTLSFSATDQNGQPIQNATAKIEIKNSQDDLLETSNFNTTLGTFEFNYTSDAADILTFTPTGLTTHDGQEYTVDSDGVFVGESIVVWYDSFDVSMVSFDVSSLEKTVVTVNVTYLLIPGEGLTLNNQFLPKIVQNALVLINGVEANETSPGIFTGESSTFLDTAYVNVRVSQEGWTTTDTAFGFNHEANQQIWIYGIIIASIIILAGFGIHFAVYRKSRSSSTHSNKPFFALVLLLVTSALSLYWGVVAIEGIMHTFDWLLFALACFFSFAFGLVGSVLILRKKLLPLTIFVPVIPLIVNTVIVKSVLDASQIASPWLMLVLSFLLSAACIIFISNSDKAFQKPKQTA